MAKSQQVKVPCGRCDGKGAIASFTTRYSGKCFACSGSGYRWMTRATYEKKQALAKQHDDYFAEQRRLHPICKTCGYAHGGADGYTERACKCGLSGPALSGGVRLISSTPKEQLTYGE